VTDVTTRMTPKLLARVAGPLYLLLIVAAAFAVSVRAAIVEPGAAAATADNIRASATLFRVSFVVDVFANLVYLLTAMALYLLFRHVNQVVAAAMVVFVAVGVAVGSLNLLNQHTALTIATSDAFARGFGRAGADELALLFAGRAVNGNILNAVWNGPWLLPLAYLVIKSGYFPKALGVLQVVGCLGHLGWMLVTFLASDAPDGLSSAFMIAAAGEGAFLLWLLVRGVRLPAAAPARPIPQPQP
jgi:hypothetical protein